MSMLAVLTLAIGGVIVLVGYLIVQLRRQGRLEERVDDAKRGKAALAAAHKVRDRLRGDAGFAERVRRRFSR